MNDDDDGGRSYRQRQYDRSYDRDDDDDERSVRRERRQRQRATRQRSGTQARAKRLASRPPSPNNWRRCRAEIAKPELQLLAPAPQAAQPAPQRHAKNDGRGCLGPRAHLARSLRGESFGPMQLISTCRPGARIAGSGRISKHASGEAIDFNAGRRKGDVVRWLIANHKSGGTMTYAGMSHIHVDVGYHFVALNSGGGR
jgi:hypothetical protein